MNQRCLCTLLGRGNSFLLCWNVLLVRNHYSFLRRTHLILPLPFRTRWSSFKSGDRPMLRRDPEAIVTAHLMDRARRELYVEGRRDRIFLDWLISTDRHPDVSVVEISSVNLPEISGGERGRLLHFARLVCLGSA